MRRLLMLAALALLPAQGFAATCTTVAAPGDPGGILVVDVAPHGGFYVLSGEFVYAGAYFPAHGSAHLRGDGKVHFAVMVLEMCAGDPSCVPFWLDGTVDPPSYTSGSAVGQGADGVYYGTLAITPAACPAPD